MTTVNIATLAPEALEVVIALRKAAGLSDADDERRIRDSWLKASALRVDADKAAIVARLPRNPYINPRCDWGMRESLFYRRPDWHARREAAHDLRTGSSVVTSTRKRRYVWAIDAFREGYLTPDALLREATWFDEVIAADVALEASKGAAINDRFHAYLTAAWKEHEVKRLRREARQGFIARDRWLLVHRWDQAVKEVHQRWQQAQADRLETARQRAHLREGRQTLTAIRRHLRGQDRLPLPESRPERTSQT